MKCKRSKLPSSLCSTTLCRVMCHITPKPTYHTPVSFEIAKTRILSQSIIFPHFQISWKRLTGFTANTQVDAHFHEKSPPKLSNVVILRVQYSNHEYTQGAIKQCKHRNLASQMIKLLLVIDLTKDCTVISTNIQTGHSLQKKR